MTGRWPSPGRPNPGLVFHVGDLAQEYPGSRFFDTGRRAAVTQFEASGLTVNFAAGNMDIGDKPDPTVPAGWVEPGFLKRWDEDFGKSFYSRTEGDRHFIVLNSQIMNTTLPEAMEQREWLELELVTHAGYQVFLFLHLPPFLVDEDEPGLGSYDVLDDPDRSWLLELCRNFDVEAMFSGHTHFQVFNRAGDTRLYTLPSTTTTRPGFYEAFNVLPPERGWTDVAKLGFFLVRMTDAGTSVHLIPHQRGDVHAPPGRCPHPDRYVPRHAPLTGRRLPSLADSRQERRGDLLPEPGTAPDPRRLPAAGERRGWTPACEVPDP